MNVSVERVVNDATLKITLPAEEVNKGFKKAISKIANSVNIPGFRKGKAPRNIIEMHYGKDAIKQEAFEIVANDCYTKALDQESLIPVSDPKVEESVFEENKDMEHLTETVIKFIDEQYPVKDFTFKVHARRGDKQFPLDSMAINMEIGGQLLDAFEGIKVDVHHPQVMVNIEVRKYIYIYSQEIKGPGGMPIGTNGKAMLLLSGGIDSPVAGYMIAKRGVHIDATYFHAPPYTSERAKQKVVDLARLVSKYAGPITLNVVNFTDIQLAIYEKCPHDELTIIMRRYMMKIAEHFANEGGSLALITGESIGQVASQTIHNLAITNEVCNMPVFRPCIGMDKQEIVDIAEKIGTFETSIQPFEDCCTIFVAKHPVTKPNIDVIRRSEENLNEKIDELMKQAIETVEIIEVK